MAHQTSAIQRKQATPLSIGRLMDVDFLGGHFHSSVARVDHRKKLLVANRPQDQ